MFSVEDKESSDSEEVLPILHNKRIYASSSYKGDADYPVCLNRSSCHAVSRTTRPLRAIVINLPYYRRTLAV